MDGVSRPQDGVIFLGAEERIFLWETQPAFY